jgi:hypothetical protein
MIMLASTGEGVGRHSYRQGFCLLLQLTATSSSLTNTLSIAISTPKQAPYNNMASVGASTLEERCPKVTNEELAKL